jgi:hypothetical protein
MDDERAEPEDPEEDTEGQALTWIVRKPIPEAEDDTEGQAMRPPPDVENEGLPRLEEEDEVEGNGGGTRSPRPPVD